ncbi:NDR1/HIN1-like protein 13 [Rhododendron vialii]|uniref:NDR1/HIN1-like protein 13 n=1 Tax=Rhododendron vialii TaxID=182163 RepID=UPI00265E7E9C|nr:NDR1/HIN1-like protein 13 [Rhododendron vialii]
MTERIHPTNSPPSSGEAPPTSSRTSSAEAPQPPLTSPRTAGSPAPGTYVIQIPKDTIYRYPRPENARRYEKKIARQKPRRSCCRCFCCWTLGVLALVVFLLAAAAGILYLVFRPEAPKYSIEEIAISGFNLTSPSAISPEFDVTVRAENPNDKIGIYYGKGSSVSVYYSDVNLCNGNLPAFYQPSNNVTVFQTALKGSKILLTSAVNAALASEQKQGEVPFSIRMKVPVKIKFGAVKTWTITVKVTCEVAVDGLTTSSKIVSSDCKKSLKIW